MKLGWLFFSHESALEEPITEKSFILTVYAQELLGNITGGYFSFNLEYMYRVCFICT